MKKVFTENNIKWMILLLFAILIIPILYIGRYNIISADDFAYGYEVHQEWLQNGSLLACIKKAFEVVGIRYQTWQGTYSSILFMALNPLYFNIHLGWLIPLFLLFMLCLSSFFCINELKKYALGIPCEKQTGLMISVLFLIFTTQSFTAPVEAFYWYNGSVHYILINSFMLLYIGFFIREEEKFSIRNMLILIFLGFLIGGGNYISALLAVEISITLLLVNLFCKKVSVGKIAGFLSLCAGFLISVLAPGNEVRQAGADGMGAMTAIISSFPLAISRIKEWCTPLFIACLFLMLPYLWKVSKLAKLKFRYPILVSIFLFCLYASNFTPCLYGVGNADSGRMKNIIQANFYLLFLVGIFYMMGAFARKVQEKKSEWALDFCKVEEIGSKYVWLYKGILFTIVILILGFTGDKNTYTSVSATRSLVIGEAQLYDAEGKQRNEIISSDESDIYLEPFSVHPHVLYFADYVTKDDKNNWINRAAAQYYNKNSIQLIND